MNPLVLAGAVALGVVASMTLRKPTAPRFVTLEAGRSYRLTFEGAVDFSNVDNQTDTRVELIALGAFDVAFAGQGGYGEVSFSVLRVMATSVTLGSPLSTGPMGSKLFLKDVQGPLPRMDGGSA